MPVRLPVDPSVVGTWSASPPPSPDGSSPGSHRRSRCFQPERRSSESASSVLSVLGAPPPSPDGSSPGSTDGRVVSAGATLAVPVSSVLSPLQAPARTATTASSPIRGWMMTRMVCMELRRHRPGPRFPTPIGFLRFPTPLVSGRVGRDYRSGVTGEGQVVQLGYRPNRIGIVDQHRRSRLRRMLGAANRDHAGLDGGSLHRLGRMLNNDDCPWPVAR